MQSDILWLRKICKEFLHNPEMNLKLNQPFHGLNLITFFWIRWCFKNWCKDIVQLQIRDRGYFFFKHVRKTMTNIDMTNILFWDNTKNYRKRIHLKQVLWHKVMQYSWDGSTSVYSYFIFCYWKRYLLNESLMKDIEKDYSSHKRVKLTHTMFKKVPKLYKCFSYFMSITVVRGRIKLIDFPTMSWS